MSNHGQRTPSDSTPADTATPESVSPSLRSGVGRAAAYEIKFLLDEAQAGAVEAALRKELLPDPHCDPTLGGAYAITSLALDSPALGVFHRAAEMKFRKFRVRRYGDSGSVYLECKRSRGGKVRKRRVEAALSDLGSIAAGHGVANDHAWFARDAHGLELAPVARVRYLRRALFGVCPEGPMRVTFDRSIRGALTRSWSMDLHGEERALLDGLVVCEFKFQVSMPALMKRIVSSERLTPSGVSKYRTCVRAFATELGVELRAHHGTEVKRA